MMESLPVKIEGLGRYLPRRVVPSAELEVQLGLGPGWIERRQGVRERHWVTREIETNAFMGAEAAREALADAERSADEVDLVMNASGTQEQAIPDGGPLVQRELGLGDSGIACFSVHATCLSFLVGFDLAATLLACGRCERILLVTSEISSCALDFSHPEASTLFGDGAAAVVLGRSAPGEASALHVARLETYGVGAYATQIPGGGSRRHPNLQTTVPEDNLFQMDGPAVFKLALEYAPRFLARLFAGAPFALPEMDCVVPHQASKRALDAHAALGIPAERVVRTLDRLGNCVAASIPLTLVEAVRTGRLRRGNRLLLVGTGAGLSLGGLIVTY
jgi:3-oxoacyl-[acyl-carrier-protein] synthase-3